jgi:hypothetical protein
MSGTYGDGANENPPALPGDIHFDQALKKVLQI